MGEKINPDAKVVTLIDAMGNDVASSVLQSSPTSQGQVLKLAKDDPKATAELIKQIMRGGM